MSVQNIFRSVEIELKATLYYLNKLKFDNFIILIRDNILKDNY